jgi:hypothetical protein
MEQGFLRTLFHQESCEKNARQKSIFDIINPNLLKARMSVLSLPCPVKKAKVS